MNVYGLVAIGCLIVWEVLVFVLTIPSGWVHVPLAAGCILLALGIVRGRRPA